MGLFGSTGGGSKAQKPAHAPPLHKGEEGNAQRDDVWARDTDLYTKIREDKVKRETIWTTLFLSYGSLGVIYGDIGTALIYVFSQTFKTVGPLTNQTEDQLRVDVLGAMSLIFWTITVIALIKYVFIVLRANDTGEGGTVALYAQLCRTMGISPFGTMRMQDHKQVLAMKSAASGPVRRPNLGEHRHRQTIAEAKATQPAPAVDPPIIKPFEPPLGFLVLDGFYVTRWFRRTRWAQRFLLFITMVATGLVIGDGVLMPAFSVNSAISGIHEHAGEISDGAIVGISIAVVIVLFFTQRVGTERIAFLFSPIIILWLLANLCIAIYNLSVHGGYIFNSLSPYWIYAFFAKYGGKAWEMLGGVMLCVSGTETMFAAMGHFSQPSVAMAFGIFAYPCLIISYLGQGAYLLNNPGSSGIIFWASIPTPIFWPMLVLATLAAIVASQAVITGTFSIIRQAMSLGVFPKLRVVHTNSFVEGQIFIPFVNYTLMLLCIAVIAGFGGDNNRLGEAYGVAVMAVMLVTTLMVTFIMLATWQVSLVGATAFYVFYTVVEGVFWSANLYRVPSGGWFPLAVALVVVIIMTVWWAGSYLRRRLLLQSSKQMSAAAFFKMLAKDPDASTYFGMAMPPALKMRPSIEIEKSVGSAVDLASEPVTAAGYTIFDSPPKPQSKLGAGGITPRAIKNTLSLGRKSGGVAKSLMSFGRKSDNGRPGGPSGGGDAAAEGTGAGGSKPKLGLVRKSAAPAVRLSVGRSSAQPKAGAGPQPVAEGVESVGGVEEEGQWAEIQGGERAQLRHGAHASVAGTGAGPRAEALGGAWVGTPGTLGSRRAGAEAALGQTRGHSNRSSCRSGHVNGVGGGEAAGERGAAGQSAGAGVGVDAAEASGPWHAGAGAGAGQEARPGAWQGKAEAAGAEARAAAGPGAGPVAEGLEQPPKPSSPRGAPAASGLGPAAVAAGIKPTASPPASPRAAGAAAGAGLSPVQSRSPSRTGSGSGQAHSAQQLAVAVRKAAAAQYGAPPGTSAFSAANAAGGSAGNASKESAEAGALPKAVSLVSAPSGAMATDRRMTMSLAHRPERALAMLTGLGLYYSDSPVGIPAVMRHFLRNVDAMHQVGIILTVRFLPMPNVSGVERLLVRSVDGIPNYYQVVARYGYQDVIDHRAAFVSQVITHILHKLELKAGLLMEGHEDDYIHELEGDDVEDDAHAGEGQANSMGHALNHLQDQEWKEEEERAAAAAAAQQPAPLSQVKSQAEAEPVVISRFAMDALERMRVTAGGPEPSQTAIDCLASAEILVESAKEHVVYYMGRAFTRSDERKNSLWRQITIGGLYRTLEMMAYQDSEAWQIPLDHMVELGMALEI